MYFGSLIDQVTFLKLVTSTCKW